MNATQGWKDNTHYPHTHTHKQACTLTYMHTLIRKHMPPHIHIHTHTLSWWWHIFLSGCKVNVKCTVGNDDVKVWSCELDGEAPYGSLRPCHYLVTPLTSIQRARERKAERERERAWITQDHATTEIVWGQQCHNYFKMSACNKIQQFIWQKAN